MSRDPSFRAVRRARTFHFLAQAGLLLTLFAGLNYLAGHAGWRFDLTARHRHSLSAETLAYLKNLAQPVTIINTFDEQTMDDDTRRDVAELLAEYAHATERSPAAGRVTVQSLNVVERAREAKERGLEDKANLLLVQCGERRRFIEPSDLYRVENKTHDRTAFLGESAVTAAILDVTSHERTKIYFLIGHGEMPVEDADADRGLRVLGGELQARNFALQTLDLSRVPEVPSDAALVIIAGPQGPLHPSEVGLLRRYLGTRAGSVVALLAPKSPHGLDDLLDEWGVLADDVLVCDSGLSGQNDSGDLILTAIAKSDHPIIRVLASNQIPVRFGAARSARLDLGHSDDPGLRVTELIATAPTAWGERNYSQPGPPVFNRGVDLAGPITVATASERVKVGGKNPVPGGRLVVFGGADWVANGRIVSLGNLTLFLNTVNWAMDRDANPAIAGVPARPIERLQLTLTSEQLQHLRYALIFGLPGAAALLGLAVFWARRR